MTRREKIILAITGLVAAGGLMVLLGGKTPPPGAPQPAPGASGEAARAAGMLKSIQEAAMGKGEVAVLAAIDRPWRVAAFYDRPLAGHEAAVKPATLPRYTGFVELGSGKLAVIDGMEYQAGDSLEGGGYKVLSVTPDQVVLESLAGGTRVTVPYEGQDAR